MSVQERDRSHLLRLQTGDPGALESLYDSYTPLLYSVVLRIVGSAPEAEDVLQEVWLQIWKQAQSYDGRRGSVAAWLLTVARSRALDRYRSTRSRRRAEEQSEGPSAGPGDDPAVHSAHAQLNERLVNALSRLEPQQRQVLELAYFGGLSQSEIAARLEAPLGTVKSWTRQGLLQLRASMPRAEWT